MFRVILCCAAILAAALPGYASEFKQGNITINNPWARPTAGDVTVGAVYLTVQNNGIDDDSLRGGTTPVAQRVEIHEGFQDEQGVMKMRQLEFGLEVPAGESVELRPGGYHVMLFGLKQKLEEGTTVPLTLSFARAGDIALEVKVEQAPKHLSESGAAGHGHGHHGHHGNHGHQQH